MHMLALQEMPSWDINRMGSKVISFSLFNIFFFYRNFVSVEITMGFFKIS